MRGGAAIIVLPLLAVAILTGGLVFACLQDSKRAAQGDSKNWEPEAQAPTHGVDEDVPAAGLLQIRSVLPDFTFTDQDGRAMGKQDLLGKVWIADFIYVKCAGPCPAMTVSMKKLQDVTDSESGLSFVTFTVDPERDTIEDLKRYAMNTDADPERWHFLRGEATEVAKLMREGFLLGSADDPLNHSTRFCLVDQTGRVRGHYDHKRGDDMIRLRKHANLLLTGVRN